MMTKEALYKFIDKQKTIFVTSVDEDGYPNIKAMFAPRRREGNCLYLTTNTSSLRTQQFLKNPKSSVYFYARKGFSCEGVMLIGTMEVLQDLERKKSIWEPGDTLYYPQGVSDPDYCVYRFTAKKARHYHRLKTTDIDL